MKTWILVVVQLWALAFAPFWFAITVFAPLALANNGSVLLFAAFMLPPAALIVCSIAMWLAKAQGSARWQKICAAVLALLSPAALVVLYGG